MQGGRPPQPSGTNRPSSSACPSHGRSRGTRRLRALCGPQGTAAPPRRQNAPRRPAAMAGEAHPVPSRTRKLSPRAPIVLRVQPVGDQDAAGRLGAFSPQEGPRAERGAPFLLRLAPRPHALAAPGPGRGPFVRHGGRRCPPYGLLSAYSCVSYPYLGSAHCSFIRSLLACFRKLMTGARV